MTIGNEAVRAKRTTKKTVAMATDRNLVDSDAFNRAMKTVSSSTCGMQSKINGLMIILFHTKKKTQFRPLSLQNTETKQERVSKNENNKGAISCIYVMRCNE